MTTTAELLTDGFGRVHGVVHRAVSGLSVAQLGHRVDGATNSIGWLVWHLARVQDDHIAEVAGQEQVWTAAGWHERLGLPFEPAATGYGQDAADVAAVQVSADQLLDYFDAVHEATIGYVRRLRDADLDRVVDTAWDPPVTLAVRLVSVISDDLQHAGQAALLRGIVERAG
jgi:uncharacterized damage-inducible protein DinB